MCHFFLLGVLLSFLGCASTILIKTIFIKRIESVCCNFVDDFVPVQLAEALLSLQCQKRHADVFVFGGAFLFPLPAKVKTGSLLK
ncbi:hypothetical protein EVA_15474 [gut metagenome]|uniref:Uncharacterized protein n=1 Tax=gut metagenome TaxID=749906 RepID=J9FN98_9ZZZZ